MQDWSDGYVADIDYTHGYYTELNPLRIRLALINCGLVAPDIQTGCELGFGQGLSVNLHAAASGVQWFGTDFNPAQAGFAQELAAVAGSNARLYDDAFAEFAARADLPDFDFIGLHGIWSWISDQNRSVIVDFLRRKLKVGGVLYISYNTQPGWAQMMPMRHLLTEHAAVMGVPGSGIVPRIDAALEFAERLLATQPLYGRANPQIAERIARLKTQDRHYLAHEYFNRDWHPMPFARMAEWLAPAKLSYAASAHFLDHIDAVNLTADQQVFLGAIPQGDFRQTVRDYMVNQQFRRDYWVKGARRLNALEQAEQLRTQRVVLSSVRNNVQLKVNGSIGEAGLNEDIYRPLLDMMADCRVRSIHQIEQEMQPRGVNRAQLLQAIFVLMGKGDLSPASDARSIDKRSTVTAKINTWLQNKAMGSSDINYLVSPVTAGGIVANRFEQLFLLALQRGAKQPPELAAFVWRVISVQNQRLIHQGKQLMTEEENLAELSRQATEFMELKLPVFKALQVA